MGFRGYSERLVDFGLQALSPREIRYDPYSSSILKLTFLDTPDTKPWRVIKEDYSYTHIFDRKNEVIMPEFPLLD